MSSEGRTWPDAQVMSYLEFCFLPETILRKVGEGALYGFWRQYGDVYGEARTVKEWLDDFGWYIIEPTEKDLKDLDLFLGHDEFWGWSSGKVGENEGEYSGISLFEKFKKLFIKK